MSKYLLIDTREKPRAITKIIQQLDEAGIRHESCKLLFGDYMDYNRPGVVIDRKQNIAELAKNVTGPKEERDRFKAELERAKAAGAHLVILVEQNRYKDPDRGEWKQVREIKDLMLWSNPHTSIRGERVFRALTGLIYKYDISIMFCDKRVTGRKIIEVIYGRQ